MMWKELCANNHPWGESRLSKQLLNRGRLHCSPMWLSWLLTIWRWQRCWHHETRWVDNVAFLILYLILMFLLTSFLWSGWSDLSSQPANCFPTGTLVLQFYSCIFSYEFHESLNCRPARLPWSSLAPSQVLPWAALIKSLPPHSQPSAIFVITFSPSTASPWTLTLAHLKNLPAGCGANTRITFLLDLSSEISALFLSDDSKSPVPLSNLLTSQRVTQKPKKEDPTTLSCKWYKAPLCGQEN